MSLSISNGKSWRTGWNSGAETGDNEEEDECMSAVPMELGFGINRLFVETLHRWAAMLSPVGQVDWWACRLVCFDATIHFNQSRYVRRSNTYTIAPTW